MFFSFLAHSPPHLARLFRRQASPRNNKSRWRRPRVSLSLPVLACLSQSCATQFRNPSPWPPGRSLRSAQKKKNAPVCGGFPLLPPDECVEARDVRKSLIFFFLCQKGDRGSSTWQRRTRYGSRLGRPQGRVVMHMKTG